MIFRGKYLADLENIEIELLLDAIYRKYGYDFRQYAKASMNRRIKAFVAKSGINHISEVIPTVLHDPKYFYSLLNEFSIQVTEMFRDPDMFKFYRVKVLPYMHTYPYVRIWHAGCATGEEVYSSSIILKEEKLLDKTTIFATDFNDVALHKAKSGLYPIENLKQYTENYINSGGIASFSDYYTTGYDSAIITPEIKDKITFANHNLATDSAFGEMNIIFCRNVLIYFDKELQNRVLELFYRSLMHRGYLILGSKETLEFTPFTDKFEVISSKDKIYRKID